MSKASPTTSKNPPPPAHPPDNQGRVRRSVRLRQASTTPAEVQPSKTDPRLTGAYLYSTVFELLYPVIFVRIMNGTSLASIWRHGSWWCSRRHDRRSGNRCKAGRRGWWISCDELNMGTPPGGGGGACMPAGIPITGITGTWPSVIFLMIHSLYGSV
jgi:hypothetical protein